MTNFKVVLLSMLKDSKPVILHTLEVLIIALAVWGIFKLFAVDSGKVDEIVTVLIIALVKAARSLDFVPINDYVNEK